MGHYGEGEWYQAVILVPYFFYGAGPFLKELMRGTRNGDRNKLAVQSRHGDLTSAFRSLQRHRLEWYS